MRTSTTAGAWNPSEEMFGGPSGEAIAQRDLEALMDACPQPGPNFYVQAPAAGPVSP